MQKTGPLLTNSICYTRIIHHLRLNRFTALLVQFNHPRLQLHKIHEFLKLKTVNVSRTWYTTLLEDKYKKF